MSIVTLLFLAIIVYSARHEIVKAWELMGQVNLWILALLIPLQVISYFIGGEMMFSYLREKKVIDHIPVWKQARMALEMNFVNHVLPSAGVSGISYMSWRMKRYGISPGRATLAQLIRFVAGFAAFIVLLLVSLFVIAVDGDINRWIILFSALLIGAMVGSTILAIFILSSSRRTKRSAQWIGRAINAVVRTVTFGYKKNILAHSKVEHFFNEIHDDFLSVKREKKLLLRPFLWGLVFNVVEVAMFVSTFYAFGVVVNPAPILIAYGLASLAGFAIATPGGAGAYEAIMVSFLTLAGAQPGVAIAAVLLTRVILLLGTILLGYVFYQDALLRYGKRKHSA